MCRQRLIEYGQNRTDIMDVGFVGYVQCSEEACAKMQVSHTPTSVTGKLHCMEHSIYVWHCTF